jgi:hypothetical protein
MLRQLDDDLWVTERALRFGGVELGARMTVIRLRDGGLFLHSPLGLDDALRGELEHLGTPRFAVAPNRFHHLYIGAYRDAFPGVQLYAAPGLPEKRRDVRFDGVLDSDDAAHGWDGEIDQVFVRGYPLMNEVVFCHRASRSLLTCDLMFNIREDAPFMTRLAFRLIGGYGRCGPTLVERFFVRDRAAARVALQRVLAWDFDRVVVAHGQVLEHGGREALRSGYDWVLGR